jgi:hypothetical protein
MIEMMQYLDERFSLTLILQETNLSSSNYARKLKKMAQTNSRIDFLEIMPQDRLIQFCNDYDIGFFFMPPSNTNITNSLANKFFQYLQSRLMLVVSPLPEMKRLVEAYNLGLVGENFDIKALAQRLNSLGAEEIMYFKRKSHESARELSSDFNRKKLQKIIEGIFR